MSYKEERNFFHEFEDMSCYCMTVDSDMGAGNVEAFAETVSVTFEEDPVVEPCVGMEFESEDAAKEFYDEYARRTGFVMRIDQCRRSEVDKRILSRRLSCNKQGFYVKIRDQFGPVRKPRPSTRQGCKAMMLVKLNKSGKWVVTRFIKDHTHPLVVSGRPSRGSMVSFPSFYMILDFLSLVFLLTSIYTKPLHACGFLLAFT